ncbi:tetratricopeptide repeat protein [Streptomyces sp. NPDC049597]|uniref:tetratricopeptide repeat protein n=1 Tax=Streptomyces sp. NPDC049597 TaxID=3155276 RepID=UPI00342CAA7C
MSWSLTVPSPSNSAAVVVGTATHVLPSGLPSLPQAELSVAAVGDALVGPLGSFDSGSVHRCVDPPSAADVFRLLPAPGTRRLDVLLFYFAGHGLCGEGDRLCLALPGSVDDVDSAERTSLPVTALFQAMRQVRAEHRVAVLDCCFAGRALDAADAADIHVLAAAGRTRRALTPEGHLRTGFTTVLLDLLADGVPDGPEHLDLATLYRRLAVRLPAAGLPAPLQRTFGSSGDLALFRNTAHGTALSEPGLLARARFADQVRTLGLRGRAGRLDQAVRLLRSVADDAARVMGQGHPDTLRYRHVHAAAVGEAGDPATACALLEQALADGAAAPDGGTAPALDALRSSLAYWRARAVPHEGSALGQR